MKDIILVVTLLLTITLSVVVVRFNEKASKAGKRLDEERFSRMVAEEALQKKAAELATLKADLKSNQDKMAKVQDILDQEKGVNTDLKAQYDKLAQSKAELEAKMQKALQEKEIPTPEKVEVSAAGQ